MREWSELVLRNEGVESSPEAFQLLDNTTCIVEKWYTIFPRSDALATINFALAATIPGRCLLQGGVNYTLHHCLAASILIMSCSKVLAIFGSDYCWTIMGVVSML